MDETNESALLGGLDLGGSRMPSCLNGVGARDWLTVLFTDLADEDLNSTEGDPISTLD